jgi:anhydro-N-acetylmuramic acid kinase
MLLDQLRQKKRLVIIGLNSGTSSDGVDAAAVRFAGDVRRPKPVFLRGFTRAFPASLKLKVAALADSDAVALEDVMLLDNLLGIHFGQAAKALTSRLGREGIKVDAIASHGQTVRHWPGGKRYGGKIITGSIQLGSPEQISTITGKTVVSHFRQGDIAVGGEGAPITVHAMRQMFADRREPRLIVNIGGMANYFYFPVGRSTAGVRAADCGPGNVLSDLLTRKIYGIPFDRDGKIANSGRVHQQLFKHLRRHPFFRSSRVSTGREEFGTALVDKILDWKRRYRIPKRDVITTAAHLTVYGIVNSTRQIRNADSNLSKLYLTGGGARNKFFLQRLSEELGTIDVGTVQDLGFDPDLIEAAAFATMGWATLRGKASPTRFVSGRRQTVLPVLGRIIQPPQKA